MLTIDGLVTGIDSTSVIEGLLEIQQRQIDNFNARKTSVVEKQTSFSGIEARLIGLRGNSAVLPARRPAPFLINRSPRAMKTC